MTKKKHNPLTALRNEIDLLKIKASSDDRLIAIQRAKIEVLDRLVLKLGGYKGTV